MEEHENDIRMARAQQELLDRQDRERAAFFQKMKDKQSAEYLILTGLGYFNLYCLTERSIYTRFQGRKKMVRIA